MSEQRKVKSEETPPSEEGKKNKTKKNTVPDILHSTSWGCLVFLPPVNTNVFNTPSNKHHMVQFCRYFKAQY